MKFGNPISSVSINGGTVAITSAGTLSTSGAVTSIPSAIVTPTLFNTASSGTLIADPTGTVQIILVAFVISGLSTAATALIQLHTVAGGNGATLLQVTGGSSGAQQVVSYSVPMNGLMLATLTGLVITNSAGWSITAQYTTTAVAGSSLSSHVLQGGL